MMNLSEQFQAELQKRREQRGFQNNKKNEDEALKNQKDRENDPFFVNAKKEAENYIPKQEQPKEQITTKQAFDYFVSQIKLKTQHYDPQNEALYGILAMYLTKSKSFEENKTGLIKNKPSLDKGLFIYSPPGLGKTSVIKIFSKIGNHKLVNLTDIKHDWDHLHSFNCTNHHEIKNKYCSVNVNLFIDEAGREEKTQNRKYVLEEIIEARYKKREDFIGFGHKESLPKTSMLSNFSLNQLKDKYGEYITDRINQMCNIIELKGKSLRQ